MCLWVHHKKLWIALTGNSYCQKGKDIFFAWICQTRSSECNERIQTFFSHLLLLSNLKHFPYTFSLWLWLWLQRHLQKSFFFQTNWDSSTSWNHKKMGFAPLKFEPIRHKIKLNITVCSMTLKNPSFPWVVGWVGWRRKSNFYILLQTKIVVSLWWLINILVVYRF